MSALSDLYREALCAYALRQQRWGDAIFGPEAAVLDDLSGMALAGGTAAYVAAVRAKAREAALPTAPRSQNADPAPGSV